MLSIFLPRNSYRPKIFILFLWLAILPLVSCSNTITSFQSSKKPYKTYSTQLLENKERLGSNRMKIFYLGLALWGNADRWSENDIINLKAHFSSSYSERELIPFIVSNRVSAKRQLHYPPYDTTNIRQIVRFIADYAADHDLIAIVISTHGYPGGVRNKVGIAKDQALSAGELKLLFDPISNKQIIMIIYSCYAGSLISDLHGDQTVILTASSAKRPSFGCDQQSENTWFVASLKSAALYLQKKNERFSLMRWFKKARQLVAERELDMGVTASNPQIFIGRKVNSLHFKL